MCSTVRGVDNRARRTPLGLGGLPRAAAVAAVTLLTAAGVAPAVPVGGPAVLDLRFAHGNQSLEFAAVTLTVPFAALLIYAEPGPGWAPRRDAGPAGRTAAHPLRRAAAALCRRPPF